MVDIYVASKFENKAAVRAAQTEVRKRGWGISFDWTGEAVDVSGSKVIDWNTPYQTADEAHLRESAYNDYCGVTGSSAVLILNHAHGCGMWTEMGIAIAHGIPVYVVGPEIRRNIFFYLPESFKLQTFSTLEEALARMESDFKNKW